LCRLQAIQSLCFLMHSHSSAPPHFRITLTDRKMVVFQIKYYFQ
jgi:hypothetical protein